MPQIGFWEILLIAVVILLLFGATRIPDLMRGLAKGIRGFKDEMKTEDKPEAGQAGEKPKPS
ncbi:MAG: twin-arginine translocase TatA/TatE family subunit [Acidobacteria bacterium]|nr:twin-arginine translocase TatA/TatE family subunit [Acidobacteriota bacterium]